MNNIAYEAVVAL